MDATTATLASVINTSMLNGVLDEVIACLPIVVPVSIGFLAIRKGIGFVFGMLRKA